MVRKIIDLLRAKYYSLFFKIGKGCCFGRIKFWDCEKNSILIGKNVKIFRKTELCAKRSLPIQIGDNTFINQRCIIRPNVKIGKNVSIGPDVLLLSDSHEIGPSEKRAGKNIYSPIHIGDGCWIGARSTILGNVIIGHGTIIGSGSVVIKDCEPNSLYAGVPAKLIRKID